MSSTSKTYNVSNNVVTDNVGIIKSSIPNQLNYNSSSDNSLTPVTYSFAVSVILLLLVSYQKYHMDRVNKGYDYFLYFLEFPIDLGNVIISIFVAYYFLVENINAIFIAIFIEMLVMVISMTLRFSTIELLNADSIQKMKIFYRICCEFILILLPAVFSYILIFK